MSLWRNTEKRALPSNIDPYAITARPLYSNFSGEVVNEFTSFASSAMLAAVTLLADSIATMPLELVRVRDGRRELLPLPSVLSRPNMEQTMFEFVHQVVLSLAVHGVAYIYAPRQAGELPVEMVVIHPDRVRNEIDRTTGAVYQYIGETRYDSGELMCIHWLRLPGRLRGISPLEALRNTVGISLAMDRFLAQFYGDGATPSSVFETDKPLTKEQADLLRETWEETHWKRRRPAVLAGGLRWRSITVSASDAQMLEHREAIVRDIARAYRIPAHLIGGQGSSQTYQNVESAGINFVRHTLLPWMRRIEDALSEKLPVDQFVRFNADELMRADLTTRVNAAAIQINAGMLNPNEARAIEGRPPYEGGDEYKSVTGQGAAESEPEEPEEEETEMEEDEETDDTEEMGAVSRMLRSRPTDTPVFVHETPQDISIQLPEQRVHVDSPIVNIEPQVIHVPETVVHVEAPAPKMIRRKVERDKDGRISAIIDERVDD